MISEQVAKTEFGKYLVSTVKLPGFTVEEDGWCYETMVFDTTDGRWTEETVRRCPTRSEAIKNHTELVEEYRNK